MPPELLISCDKTHLIFSEFSFAVDASFALSIASKLLLKILLVGWHVRASLSLIANDNFGFLPIDY